MVIPNSRGKTKWLLIDMREVVEAPARVKFGDGVPPYNPWTDEPYKNNEKVRSAGEGYSQEFKDCVSIMAQYTYDKSGKFPATVPSIGVSLYMQTHNWTHSSTTSNSRKVHISKPVEST